jgi:hypothetical protein
MGNLQYAKEVMPLFIDSAKNYAQTSSAALAFRVILAAIEIPYYVHPIAA